MGLLGLFLECVQWLDLLLLYCYLHLNFSTSPTLNSLLSSIPFSAFGILVLSCISYTVLCLHFFSALLSPVVFVCMCVCVIISTGVDFNVLNSKFSFDLLPGKRAARRNNSQRKVCVWGFQCVVFKVL